MIVASGTLGAGFVGFLVVLGLIVTGVFLMRSMGRHLKNVPDKFDVDHPPLRDNAFYRRPGKKVSHVIGQSRSDQDPPTR